MLPDPVARGLGRGRSGWLQSVFYLGSAHMHVCVCVCVRERDRPEPGGSPACSLCSSVPFFHSYSSSSWPTCVFQAAGLQTSFKSSPDSLVISLGTAHSAPETSLVPKLPAWPHWPFSLVANRLMSLQPLAPLPPPSASFATFRMLLKLRSD